MASSGTPELVEVPLRDNFYQTSAFVPMSFALVSTVHEDGATGIGPHALCYPFGITRPYSMLLISRANSGTASNIRRTGKCALNYLTFDREQLGAIARLGLPGQSIEDKQRAMPFTLAASRDAGRAADAGCPQIIAEAFQVMECTWDRSYQLDSPPANPTEVGASRFVLQIDRLWIRAPFTDTLDQGGPFPAMPVFFGFRNPGDFWFAEHGEPFSVALPKVEGLEALGIFYLANRLDPAVRFTRSACELLTGVPKPFIRNALLGIIAAAKSEGVAEVDVAFMQAVRSRAGSGGR
jgi:flavin reductase (DIM6/NTAB) family NADH-FMN oxidoreductase RutF